MRYFSYAFALMLFYISMASGEQLVKFDIAWDAPINEDGTLQEIDNYVVYACNEPMPDSFGGTLSDNPIIGKCPTGNLVTYEVPGDQTDLQNGYPIAGKKKKGEVYLRVTARRIFDTELGTQYLESEPSDEVGFSYFMKPGKPTGVRVEEVK